jgi:anti-sigma B factor antagonist
MIMETRNNRGATIVDVVGHIDLASSPDLRKTLMESLTHTDRLAVNLLEVKYIDSSGIASLLEVLKVARNTRKRFVLFGLTHGVREVLQLTRLTSIFDIRETEDEVLNA